MAGRLGVITLCWLAAAPGVAAQEQHYDAGIESKDTIQYGKWEARMMIPAGAGMIGAFYLFDPYAYLSGSWHEIDMEIFGKANDTLETKVHIHENPPPPAIIHHPERVDKYGVPFMLADAYHTYTTEWTPDCIRWGLDGKYYREINMGDDDKLDDMLNGLHDARVQVVLSLRGFNEAWCGWLDYSTLPRHEFVNWIKAYDYTPGKGQGGSDFSLRWEDTFDSLDTSRWYLWDWPPTNPGNVTVKNGTLVLSLTEVGDPLGYHEPSVPPDTGEVAVHAHSPRDALSEGAPGTPEISVHGGSVFCRHEGGRISVRCFDLHGRLLRSIVDESRGAGTYVFYIGRIADNGGPFLVRVRTGSQSVVRRVVEFK